MPADLSSNPEPLYFIPFEQVQLGGDAQVELIPHVLREFLAIAGIAARKVCIFQVGLLGHLQESFGLCFRAGPETERIAFRSEVYSKVRSFQSWNLLCTWIDRTP